MSDIPPCSHPGCRRLNPHQHCAVCERAYISDPGIDPSPPICGRIHCRARHYWTPDDWAGRARMARARQAAGIELDDFDHEALRRSGEP
jgi:hypothetical protein